jgi:hypothetical protein
LEFFRVRKVGRGSVRTGFLAVLRLEQLAHWEGVT